jgi:GNAT superfamily N-acetyltransferase
MEGIILRLAMHDDLDILASMNKQLIEDEKHDNKMNAAQLKERMRGFIDGNYNAYMFMNDGEAVGYALVDMSRDPLYIRQFFISREHRRRGFGRAALSKLLEMLGTGRADIEVLWWNETGKSFWKSMGFNERSIYMRLE